MDGPYGAITQLTFNNVMNDLDVVAGWSGDRFSSRTRQTSSWGYRADGTGQTQLTDVPGTEPARDQLGCD